MGDRRGGNFRIMLLVAHVVAVAALPGFDDNTGLNLSCTNDFSDRISCHVDRQNCSEFQLTVRSDKWSDEQSCSLQQCKVGRCCCSVNMMLILGDSHTATVWGNGRSMESKKFDVKGSMKPKTPTIISVKESNGNFEVQWDWNMEGIARQSLTADVTYYNTLNMKKEQVRVQQATVSELSYYKLPGQRLESSMTYMVSVRSITNWSGMMSDSSSGFKFKTSASSDSLLLAIIISLSVAAVILSGTIYVCFDKLKSKWWDTVTKYPNPKLVVMHSSEQEVLRPVPPLISSISVDPIVRDDNKQWSKMSGCDSSGGSLQHSSGFGTGSSGVCYANTEPANIIATVQDALCKIFPNINPLSQLTSTLKERNDNDGLLSTLSDPCDGLTSDTGHGSSGLINKTYAVLLPQQNEENNPEVHMQTEVLCESTYRPDEKDLLNDHHQQASVLPFPARQDFLFPSGVSPFVETDMSYQPYNPESGTFSEDSTFSSLSSGTNITMSYDFESGDGTGCAIVDEVASGATILNSIDKGAVIMDTNACNSSAPVESQSGLLVDDGYQPFQSLVRQLDILHLEPTYHHPEEHLDRQKDELLTKIPQNVSGTTDPSFIDNVQRSQIPFLPSLSVDRLLSVIVDSDYHSV